MGGYAPGLQPVGDAGEILPVQVTVPGAKPDDPDGYTSSVSNLIAAIVPDKSIKILPVKVFNDSGVGDDSSIIAGIDKAIHSGAKVVMLTFVGPSQSSTIYQRIIDNITAEGIIVVSSVGNNPKQIEFPGNLKGVVAVGAVGPDGKYAEFSPRGNEIAMYLPGVDITFLERGKPTKRTGSTFYATTIATAAIATVLSRAGPMTPSAILKAASTSGKKLHKDGPPVLQADKFLEAAMKLK